MHRLCRKLRLDRAAPSAYARMRSAEEWDDWVYNEAKDDKAACARAKK